MIWTVVVILGLWSVFNLLFAFVPPPRMLSGYFRVSPFFVFLPDRLVMPVGRVFNFVLGTVGTTVIAVVLHNAGF